MISRKNRFNFRDKLPRQTLNSQSFNLRYDRNEEGLKVAAVVSKKVDKRAVARNKIKRQVLETVRKLVNPETSLTLVFYIKKEALENTSLDEEISSALSKIK